MSRFHARSELAENLIRRCQRFAMLSFLLGHLEHGTFSRADLFREHAQLSIELDVVVQNARAVFTPALYL